MIKAFKHKDIIYKIKTNMLKRGKCYFGEKDIQKVFVEIYSEVKHSSGGDTTNEQFIMQIYKSVAEKGIKLEEISLYNLIYKGGTMTDFSKQKTLE